MTAFIRPDPLPGMFDDVFWEYVAAHDLRCQRCDDCGSYRYPPGPTCPRCLSGDAEWTAVSGSGRVLSWAVFQRQYFRTIPSPYTVVAVELHEGPIMIGNAAIDDAITIGAPVSVCYEQTETVSGRPFTICQWRVDNE